MSRRWTGRRPESTPTTVEQLEQSLAASVASNRELRTELEAVEDHLGAVRLQLEFHKGLLVTAQAALAAKLLHAEQLERRLTAALADLKREREHTAGSCSHAAEVRDLKDTLARLEKRVHVLQQANMARDAAEFGGWESDAEIPAAPEPKALKRRRI